MGHCFVILQTFFQLTILVLSESLYPSSGEPVIFKDLGFLPSLCHDQVVRGNSQLSREIFGAILAFEELIFHFKLGHHVFYDLL